MNQLSGYIEVGGIPFKFGTNSWALFCDKKGVDLDQLKETGLFGTYEGDKVVKSPSPFVMREYFYCAYVSAMRAKGLEPLNEYAFNDVLDDVPNALDHLSGAMARGKVMGYDLGESRDFPASL